MPEGYNPSDTIKYPVIYLLDGSADEDFIHIAGLVQFHSFEWINQVPKSIVVGIATVDRKRDYTFPSSVKDEIEKFPSSGKSEKFIDFIEKEVKPMVAENFKTKSMSTIIGQSLGGLLVTQVLIERPYLFNNYVIVSPSLWWDNGSLLKRKLTNQGLDKHQPVKVYIAVGKEGLTPTIIPRVMEVDANLLADQLRSQTQFLVYFDYLNEYNHANVMHQAVSNAFLWLFDSYPKTKH